MTVKHIEFSPVQPSRTDIGWAKPVKGGFALYLYFNGKWSPQVLIDSVGTDSPEDDKEADVSNIPELVKEVIPDVIGDTVAETVEEQIATHEALINNTRNAEASDSTDYPEVILF